MFADLTTAHLADACIRLRVPVRCVGFRSIQPGMRAAGPVRPVRHFGSVDVFLEAMESSSPGEVLVVDNGGRLDEACIGDLVAREAKAAGFTGIVIWGLHRDSRELVDIALPLFSLGTIPCGPQRLDAQSDAFQSARLGEYSTTSDDFVVADDDGVIVLPRSRLDEIQTVAASIRDQEYRQAQAVAAGTTLREQFEFSRYLALRSRDPEYSFRTHLRRLDAAAEE